MDRRKGPVQPEGWPDITIRRRATIMPRAQTCGAQLSVSRRKETYPLQVLQIRVFLATLSSRFFFEPPKNPELDSWKVKETVIRYLQHTYFRIKTWEEVQSSA